MKLFDSHAHITDSKFDAREEIKNFERDNVDLCLTVGYDLASSIKAVELANKYDRVYAAVGVHPHSASELTESMCLELTRLVRDSKHRTGKTVAIGEIGLDYYRNLSPVDAQKKAVLRQIEIAHEADLPVIFHIRDAYTDMRKIISQNLCKLKKGVLLHCFSGSADEVEYYKGLEAASGVSIYFSFSGAITYKKSNYIDVIKAVPIDRLLIETDCPYLAPEPHRGKLNRPAYVYYAAQKIGEILDLPTEKIAQITHANTCRLLNI